MEIIKLKNYIGILKRNNELHIGYRKIFKIILFITEITDWRQNCC